MMSIVLPDDTDVLVSVVIRYSVVVNVTALVVIGSVVCC